MKNIHGEILVYGPNWIGDAIMSIPALKAIKKSFPDSFLHVLAVPWVKDIYDLSGIPDNIICYDRRLEHRGLKGIARLTAKIKQLNISTAIILPNSWRSALIPWIARIPIRVGLSVRYREYFFFSHSSKPEKDFKSRHQVFYYLNIVKILCPEIDKYEKEVTKTPLFLPDAEKPVLAELARRFGLNLNKPWLALAPGAQYGDAKLWWPENFSQVARRVAKEFGAQVVIFGSDADTAVARQIATNADTDFIILTGKTSLKEAIVLLGNCRALLTNDSGLMHVGAAIGVPLVAIFGSTDPVHTGPFGDPTKTIVLESKVDCHPCLKPECPHGHKRCMTEISPEETFDSVKQLWEK